MATYGSLPFAEQIAYFRQKINIPTAAWTDLHGAEHDQGFMIAGAMKADLLTDLRAAVDRVVASGASFADFKRDFVSIAQKHGWGYKGGPDWRARVIYETNLYQSYNAGREAQMASPALRKARPYGIYKHYPSDNEREEHKAHHNRVVPLDDPWWQVWSPQNGWGCKCKKFALSAADLKRRGLTPQPGPEIEWYEVRIGENGPSPRTVRAVRGIDPGFEHRPGDNRLGQMAERYIAKTAGLPADVAALGAAPLMVRERVLASLGGRLKEWLDVVAANENKRNLAMPVGVLSPRVVSGLESLAVVPQSAVIYLRDHEVIHILRSHKGAVRTVALAELERLPGLLAAPRAVFYDPQRGDLLYVFDPAPDSARSAGKIVVGVDFRGPFALRAGEKGKITTNTVKTMTLVQTQDIRQQVAQEGLVLLEGEL